MPLLVEGTATEFERELLLLALVTTVFGFLLVVEVFLLDGAIFLFPIFKKGKRLGEDWKRMKGNGEKEKDGSELFDFAFLFPSFAPVSFHSPRTLIYCLINEEEQWEMWEW